MFSDGSEACGSPNISAPVAVFCRLIPAAAPVAGNLCRFEPQVETAADALPEALVESNCPPGRGGMFRLNAALTS